jgi:hypothetical protein
LNQKLSEYFGIQYTPLQYQPPQIEPLSNNGFSEINNIQLKPWTIIEPDGNTLVCNNLAKYCREHNLNINKMRAVSKGYKKQYKGYRCYS